MYSVANKPTYIPLPPVCENFVCSMAETQIVYPPGEIHYYQSAIYITKCYQWTGGLTHIAIYIYRYKMIYYQTYCPPALSFQRGTGVGGGHYLFGKYQTKQQGSIVSTSQDISGTFI